MIHVCQYFDEQYQQHLGWGHCSVSHTLAFARRARADRLMLFHHDPRHDDFTLDGMQEQAMPDWAASGGVPGSLALAREGDEVALGAGQRAAA